MEKTTIDYSQAGDQKAILNYFKDFRGTFLDIGSNDGQTFSNSRALALLGWSGVLVEPAKSAHNKACKLYQDNPNIECINVAVGETNGNVPFYFPEDTLLSTAKESEIKQWNLPYKTEEIEMVTYDKLIERCNHKTFDFITIDAEGLDYVILQQIDLSETKLICCEVRRQHLATFRSYFEKFGMKEVSWNSLNLIYGK